MLFEIQTGKFGMIRRFDDEIRHEIFSGNAAFNERRDGCQVGVSFLPEIGMVLRGGLPKLVLLVEFSGNDMSEIEKKRKQRRPRFETFQIPMRRAKNEFDSEKYWTIRRESFNCSENVFAEDARHRSSTISLFRRKHFRNFCPR